MPRAILLAAVAAALSLSLSGVVDAAEVHDAAAAGDVKKLTALLKEDPARLNAPDRNDETPLHFAVYHGQKAAVDFLLSQNARVDIYSAAGLGLLDRVKAFVETDAGAVNAPMKTGVTPLHWAATLGQKAVAEYLISKGAAVNARARGGATPLHGAAESGNRELVALLLDRGADVKAADWAGRTPLYSAAVGGKKDVVGLLLSKGLEMDIFSAAAFGAKDQVAGFIKAKPELVQATLKDGETALHCAASTGQKEVAALLIAQGADVDAKDWFGRTPLHMAAKKSLDVARLLVEKGADPKQKDSLGRTPAQIATRANQADIAAFLAGAPAKPVAPLLVNPPKVLGPSGK